MADKLWTGSEAGDTATLTKAVARLLPGVPGTNPSEGSCALE